MLTLGSGTGSQNGFHIMVCKLTQGLLRFCSGSAQACSGSAQACSGLLRLSSGSAQACSGLLRLSSGSAQACSGLLRLAQACSGSAPACSPSAQVKAAVAHVRRLKRNQRKGKLILSLWVSGLKELNSPYLLARSALYSSLYYTSYFDSIGYSLIY